MRGLSFCEYQGNAVFAQYRIAKPFCLKVVADGVRVILRLLPLGLYSLFL